MYSTPFQCETISSLFIAIPIARRTLTSPRIGCGLSRSPLSVRLYWTRNQYGPGTSCTATVPQLETSSTKSSVSQCSASLSPVCNWHLPHHFEVDRDRVEDAVEVWLALLVPVLVAGEDHGVGSVPLFEDKGAVGGVERAVPFPGTHAGRVAGAIPRKDAEPELRRPGRPKFGVGDDCGDFIRRLDAFDQIEALVCVAVLSGARRLPR